MGLNLCLTTYLLPYYWEYNYISIYLSPAIIKNRVFAYFLWQNLVFLRENVKEYNTKI